MSGSVRKSRDKFFIDLTWHGERYRLFSDRDGHPLFDPRQAARILERIRSEIDYGEFNPKNYIQRELKALRLDGYALAWLRRQELRLQAGEISHGYFRELRATVNNHLIPHLGPRDIRSLNKGHLDDFLSVLRVSAKSKKNALGILRAIFTDAVDREDILRVPKFPRVQVADPIIKWIGAEAQDAILAQFQDPVRRAYFHFLVHMGCRPGEAQVLKWDDIDWGRGLVTIHAAQDLNFYRPTTKEKDCRTLPMPQEVIGSLRALPRTIGYIFTLPGQSRPYTKQRVGKWWRKATAAAGYDIPLYQATKHSMGCRARLEGVPLDVIQDWFGHKSAASTRRYAKIQVETLKVMHRREVVVEIKRRR